MDGKNNRKFTCCCFQSEKHALERNCASFEKGPLYTFWRLSGVKNEFFPRNSKEGDREGVSNADEKNDVV